MLVYPAKKGNGVGLLIKMFIYMAALTGVVIFLHDGILESEFKERNHDKNAIDLAEDSHNSIVNPDRAVVQPNLATTSPIKGGGVHITVNTSGQNEIDGRGETVVENVVKNTSGGAERPAWWKTKRSHPFPKNKL